MIVWSPVRAAVLEMVQVLVGISVGGIVTVLVIGGFSSQEGSLHLVE